MICIHVNRAMGLRCFLVFSLFILFFSSSGEDVPEQNENSISRKLEEIVIVSMEIKDKTINESLEVLRNSCRDRDPEGTGVNIILLPSPSIDMNKKLNISFELNTAYRSLLEFCGVAGLDCHFEKHAVILTAKGEIPGPSSSRIYRLRGTFLIDDGPKAEEKIVSLLKAHGVPVTAETKIAFDERSLLLFYTGPPSGHQAILRYIYDQCDYDDYGKTDILVNYSLEVLEIPYQQFVTSILGREITFHEKGLFSYTEGKDPDFRKNSTELTVLWALSSDQQQSSLRNEQILSQDSNSRKQVSIDLSVSGKIDWVSDLEPQKIRPQIDCKLNGRIDVSPELRGNKSHTLPSSINLDLNLRLLDGQSSLVFATPSKKGVPDPPIICALLTARLLFPAGEPVYQSDDEKSLGFWSMMADIPPMDPSILAERANASHSFFLGSNPSEERLSLSSNSILLKKVDYSPGDVTAAKLADDIRKMLSAEERNHEITTHVSAEKMNSAHVNLKLRAIPIGELIRYLAIITDSEYEFREGVPIIYEKKRQYAMLEKQLNVPWGLSSSIEKELSGKNPELSDEALKNFFIMRGIPFPEGAKAFYDPSKNSLFFRNDSLGQKKLKLLIEKYESFQLKARCELKLIELSAKSLPIPKDISIPEGPPSLRIYEFLAKNANSKQLQSVDMLPKIGERSKISMEQDDTGAFEIYITPYVLSDAYTCYLDLDFHYKRQANLTGGEKFVDDFKFSGKLVTYDGETLVLARVPAFKETQADGEGKIASRFLILNLRLATLDGTNLRGIESNCVPRF